MSGFMAIMIFTAVMCSISYLFSLSKSVIVRFFSILLITVEIVVVTMWSIGYDIDHTLKMDYRNVAYFECTTMKKKGWGSTGKIYDSLKSNRSAVGSFTIGDKFSPDPLEFPSIYNPTQGLRFYNDDLWPIEYGETIGYVPSVMYR